LSQLFGDRASWPTPPAAPRSTAQPSDTPWGQNHEGPGPAWSNSLFEDNAEFGFGFRLTLDTLNDHAKLLLRRLSGSWGTI